MVLQATLTLSYHVITYKPALLLDSELDCKKSWIGQAVSAG